MSYPFDPAEHHGRALMGLLRDVRSTINLGIVYGPSGSQAMLEYSDSNYTSDKQDRKSISGHVYMLGGGPVSGALLRPYPTGTKGTHAERTSENGTIARLAPGEQVF